MIQRGEPCSPAGLTSGSRDRVSASMPLVLACRDKNQCRSAAFCDETRNTLCPRAVKKTPRSAATPARSARSPPPAGCPPASRPAPPPRPRSGCPRPARPCAWPPWFPRRRVPVPCELWRCPGRQRPAAGGSSRLLQVAYRIAPARPQGRRTVRPRSQAATASRGSHSCAATGLGLQGPAHFPHPGHPWPGQGWQSEQRGKATQALPQSGFRRPPGPAGDDHATPWDPSPAVEARVPVSLT